MQYMLFATVNVVRATILTYRLKKQGRGSYLPPCRLAALGTDYGTLGHRTGGRDTGERVSETSEAAPHRVLPADSCRDARAFVGRGQWRCAFNKTQYVHSTIFINGIVHRITDGYFVK